MIAIALGQAIMSFNVASLPVSIGGMVQTFGVPPTTVGTGIVMYSLAVAGFVMLGAKLVQRFGATRVFRVVVALFGIGQVLMTFSPAATVMLAAQGLIGLSAAVIVPALVALIANHYHGRQQATAVGALGSARAAAGVTAFLIGGLLGTFIGWRPVFGLLIVVSGIVFFLSFRLKPDEGRSDVGIDIVGVVLAAASVILISFGFNNLNRWGLGVARPGAPFDLFGLSPAPVMIVIGIVLLQISSSGPAGSRRPARPRCSTSGSSRRARNAPRSSRCSPSSRSRRCSTPCRSTSRSSRAARRSRRPSPCCPSTSRCSSRRCWSCGSTTR
jgi:MFS family permease